MLHVQVPYTVPHQRSHTLIIHDIVHACLLPISMETGCSRTTRVVGGQYVVNRTGYKLVGTHTVHVIYSQ